jgi:hypothetical protein|nr:MAG TPA: hypothetical protein [Caudoviricetes sp.]
MNDKEGRKWLLQKLYDRGFKYIFHSSAMGGYLATKQPPKFKGNRTYVSGDFERIDLLSDLLPDFNEPNYLDIGKYLGIVDWSNIPVNTPIIVDLGNGTKLKRHFAKCDGCSIYYYKKGKTSWTFDDIALAHKSIISLAGGDDEK